MHYLVLVMTMRYTNPHEFLIIPNDFEDLFGSNFIEKLNDQSITKFPMSTSFSYVHPLIYDWAMFKNDIQKSIDQGAILLSKNSLRIVQLHFDLMCLKRQNGFSEIIARLKDSNKFESAAFESRIASHYLNSGFDVEFIPESENKSSDLKVTTKLGNVVFIECKCLEDKSLVSNGIWERIFPRIRKLSNKYKFPAYIRVQPHDIISNKDEQRIVEAIESMFQLKSSNSKTIDLATIKLTKITEFQNGLHLSNVDYDNMDILKFDGVFDTRPGYELLNNPILIHIKHYYNPDRFNTIINQIKKAKKQLPTSYPTVVHIGLDTNEKSLVEEFYDQNFLLLLKK